MRFAVAALAAVSPAGAQSDGFADATFGSFSPGFSVVAFDLAGTKIDEANAVAVGWGGKILIAGGAQAAAAPFKRNAALAKLNADGTPDNNFNFGGQLHWDVLSLGFDDVLSAVGELSDGTLVAAGTAWTSGISYPIAVLVSPTGAILDQRLFGLGDYAGWAALAVQPDDRIVLAGWVNRAGNYAFLVERLLPSFARDLGFGQQGRVILDLDLSAPTYDDDLAFALALQADGKILVAGAAEYGAADTDMAVARLTSTGSLDLSFGSGTGKRTVFFDLSATERRDTARGIVVDDAGWIALAGEAQLDVAPFARGAFARLDAAGVADLAFGNLGNGRAVFPSLDNVFNGANGLALQVDGKLVAAGTGSPGAARKLSAVRLTPAGALDASWGSGFGVVAYNLYFSGAADTGSAVALQGGRAIVAGTADVSSGDSDTNLVAMRLESSLVVTDGFETADLRRWSAQAP